MSRILRVPSSLALATLLVAGCTSGRGEPLERPAPISTSTALVTWPVKSALHVDAWLHGFALIQDDTARVPYFARGYKARVTEAKRRANVVTSLDANMDRLRSYFRDHPALTNAQFMTLYFGSWETLMAGIKTFLDAGGDPRRVRDERDKAIVATFAQTFPTGADRDWLRLYTNGIQDELDKFYRSWWTEQQRAQAPVAAALDSVWGRDYLPRLQRFLNNTRQASGDFLLSLPLDGEGRAVNAGVGANEIAVGYPDSAANALDAVYVFVHEAVGAVAAAAIRDNTTPAEQRAGAGDQYQAAAAVRAGAALLQRTIPSLVDGYMRFYLRAANQPVPASNLAAEFERAFAVPDVVRDAIGRQLDVVLGGI